MKNHIETVRERERESRDFIKILFYRVIERITDYKINFNLKERERQREREIFLCNKVQLASPQAVFPHYNEGRTGVPQARA